MWNSHNSKTLRNIKKYIDCFTFICFVYGLLKYLHLLFWNVLYASFPGASSKNHYDPSINTCVWNITRMIEPTVPTKLQHVRQSARQSESLSSVVKGGGKTSDALPHSINQWCRISSPRRDGARPCTRCMNAIQSGTLSFGINEIASIIWESIEIINQGSFEWEA